MKKLLITYFSGTGNTFRAINIIKQYLSKKNIKVDLLRVNDKTIFPKEDYDEYLFAFPVYAFSPPIVYSDFLKNIHTVKAKSSSVLITYATNGYSGYAPYFMIKVLSKKGFEINRIKEFGYPEYFTQIFNPPTKESCDKIYETSDKAIIEFADAILRKEAIIIRKPKIYEILFLKYMIRFYNFFIGKVLGKLYIADKKCINCELCVKSCPVWAIKMLGKKPEWNNKCIGCNRCINNCPKKAIQTSLVRFFFHVPFAFILYFMGFEITLDFVSSIAPNLNLILLLLLKIISLIIVFIIMTGLQITVYDWIIALLEKIPFLRPLFECSFTKNYRRHKIESFQSIER